MKKLALTAVLFASSASAQFSAPIRLIDPAWQGTLARQIGDNLVRRKMADDFVERRAAESQENDTPSSSDVEQAVQLDFTPSMQRRRANYASFVERSRRADPASAGNLAETLRTDPITMMTPELAKFGLRVNNVADAYAVYWVEAWQAVHGVDGASSRVTAQAVRD